MQVQVTTTGSARDVARPRSSLSPRLYHIMICAKASDLAAGRCQGALRSQVSRCTDAVLSLGPWVKLDPGNSSIHSFLALACTVWILFWLCAGAIRWSHNRRPCPNKWSFGLDSSAPDPVFKQNRHISGITVAHEYFPIIVSLHSASKSDERCVHQYYPSNPHFASTDLNKLKF